jgi:hypothetical protein
VELFGKSASFRLKGKESRKDVIVMQGFSAETPIVSGSLIDEYQCVFEAAN